MLGPRFPFRVLKIEEHEEAFNFTILEMIRLRKETVESLPRTTYTPFIATGMQQTRGSP